MLSNLKRIFSKYTGTLRSWKLSYVINNILNYGRLSHNRKMLKKYGINRDVWRPIGTSDLPRTTELPWLDRDGGIEEMRQHPDFDKFPQEIQDELIRYVRDGYMVLNQFFSSKSVSEHNAIVDQLLESHKIDFNYSGSKLMDLHEVNPGINQNWFRNEQVLNILKFIFGKDVIPFQTIHFIHGSQQKAHSDSIHMSTFPPGYLAGVWTALEDISLEQGAIFYYPGSHRWPYVSCEDYESGNTKWKIGLNSYKNYEAYMSAMIEEKGVKPSYFLPKAGDVLIWHANLVHGGSPILQKGSTRRSMVAHYYGDDVYCYHEISQRPALIKE